MNRNNNIFNKKEVENKLKDFKEGQDYSVARENEKLIYNFHNNWLRDMMGDNWTTVYEAAENWDSDNYNHHREAAEYVSNNIGESGNRGRITYRYEHRINKDASGYKEWSWGQNFEDNSKHTWTLRARPDPRKIENGLNDGFLLPGNFKSDEEIKHQERLNGSHLRSLERDKKEFEEKLAYYESLPAEERENKDTLSLKDKINYLKREIEEEKDWINRNDIQQRGRVGRNEPGKLITDKEENNYSSLKKENQELKEQLTEVQKQLAKVLEELKKLKSSVNGKESEKLSQQIVQNERLVKENKNVSVAEVQEQVNKSQALMNELNTTASVKDDKGNGSLPYVIGGSVILAVAGIIGYLVVKNKPGILSDKVKKNKRK